MWKRGLAGASIRWRDLDLRLGGLYKSHGTNQIVPAITTAHSGPSAPGCLCSCRDIHASHCNAYRRRRHRHASGDAHANTDTQFNCDPDVYTGGASSDVYTYAQPADGDVHSHFRPTDRNTHSPDGNTCPADGHARPADRDLHPFSHTPHADADVHPLAGAAPHCRLAR
jgi:hypothetical protein